MRSKMFQFGVSCITTSYHILFPLFLGYSDSMLQCPSWGYYALLLSLVDEIPFAKQLKKQLKNQWNK